MQLRKYTLLLLTVIALVACLKEETPTSQQPTPSTGPVTVGFCVGNGPDTRTSINEDGISTSWSRDDKIALWATNNSEGASALENTAFHIYYRDLPNYAMFTAELANAMPEGQYTYYATYPTPNSVSDNTTANFTIPSMQDGKMGGGAAIMVANPTVGDQLRGVLGVGGEYEIGDDHLSLTMSHKTHALRFYARSDKWEFDPNDKIERITLIMPQDVAGDVRVNYTNPLAAMSITNGVKSITLNLDEPIGPSASAAAIEHAVAAILPPTKTFGDNDKLEVRAYTATEAIRNYFPLAGRGAGVEDASKQMAAGHVTPVALDCSDPQESYKIRFTIGTNNLGEDVNTITLTAPAGTLWSANGSSILTIDAKNTIYKNGYYDLAFDCFDEASVAAYRNLNGKSIEATYDSNSAIVRNTFTMNIDSSSTTNVELTVPYLFEEDFNGFAANSDHWKEQSAWGAYFPADSEKKGSWILNSGWSGNIWSTDGNVLKMRSYVGSYDMAGTNMTNAWFSRVDSPALPLKPNKNVKLNLSFDVTMSTNAKHGIPECIYGYSSNTNAIAGGYPEGNWLGTYWGEIIRNPIEFSISSGTNNGIYNNTFTISNTPTTFRLGWSVGITYKADGILDTITDKYFNMTLDNIKVSIVPAEEEEE